MSCDNLSCQGGDQKIMLKLSCFPLQALICRWPWTLLSFRGLFPPAFTELKSLYCNEYVCGGITFWRDLTRSLVVNFLECITQPSDTKVKYLDISGYPTGRSNHLTHLFAYILNRKGHLLLQSRLVLGQKLPYHLLQMNSS